MRTRLWPGSAAEHSAAEEWARSSGHDELANDAELDNHDSIAAHLALGFQEIERSVSFLKKL